MSTYEVIGKFAFSGYQPGEVFEAHMDPLVERRALVRRSIRIIEQSSPALLPGSYQLPRGWDTTTPAKEG